MTTSSTIGYDGSEGAEHTESQERTIGETKMFACPPHSRCEFRLMTRLLDNVDMPFVATVQRNLEVKGQCHEMVIERSLWSSRAVI
jgi:hypothetical protein